MLIELSVSNFFSFREKQTFSMVAASRLRKKENVFKPDIRGEKLPELLKVAAIYGPNASGKSNLIKALGLVANLSSREPSALPSRLPVAPFRFDPDLASEPSRIELHFIHAGQRYEFLLAATSERIVRERLVAFPRGKESMLYDRRYIGTREEYEFGDRLEGGDELHDAWEKLTGSQTLFITQAVANSSESLTQLREPLKWLQQGALVLAVEMSDLAKATQKLAQNKPEFAQALSSFLQDIDVPVTNIRFDPVHDSVINYADGGRSRNAAGLDLLIERKQDSKTTLTHKTALGEASFDFSEESKGTQNLIGFWLPWWIKGAAKNDFLRALIVDEFDSSLHPNIVASLVEKHLRLEQPTQLIFTTHDTHLMDTKLLRRDQFWLTERDMNGATQLRCIYDFAGREGEDVEKRYYEGRFRGLPFLR